MTKKTTACLWTDGHEHTITLHKPFLALHMDTGKSESVFTVIDEKVMLPSPMTSNQFNTFIRTDAGKKWAKTQFRAHDIAVGW